VVKNNRFPCNGFALISRKDSLNLTKDVNERERKGGVWTIFGERGRGAGYPAKDESKSKTAGEKTRGFSLLYATEDTKILEGGTNGEKN